MASGSLPSVPTVSLDLGVIVDGGISLSNFGLVVSQMILCMLYKHHNNS